MIFKDYYKILGLENNKVSTNEIKTAYREQAKKYHPDISSETEFSEERFKDINEAYKVLSDATARRKYDRMWNSRVGHKKKNEESKREEGSLFSNFFKMFFGEMETKKEPEIKKKSKVPQKGESVETEVDISIEEAFYGAEKKISLRRVDGKMRNFTVKIPVGIRNGEKIRLIGQGKKGENGGKNGDLFIKINILNNRKFSMQGIDMHTYLYLSPWEAVLGTRIDIDAIDDTVSLYVPQGIQSGEIVKIPGKGYHDGKGSRGDLIAEVKIMVPKNLTDEEKDLFKQLSEISKFNPRGETVVNIKIEKSLT